MTIKEQLKMEIDRLDERYLELVYKVVRQFPHIPETMPQKPPRQEAADLLQAIADTGGLGIGDPQKWQRDLRADRALPFS